MVLFSPAFTCLEWIELLNELIVVGAEVSTGIDIIRSILPLEKFADLPLFVISISFEHFWILCLV